MRRHLFGGVLFCVIVGVAIFVNLFAIPEPLHVYEPEIACPFYWEKKEEVQLKVVEFYSEIQKFKAIIKLKSFEKEKENITLHFFTKNKKSTKYFLSQNFRVSLVISNGNAFTNLTEIETLSKTKSLRNVFVIAEFERDYQENTTPIFNSEVAVPITIYKGKK